MNALNHFPHAVWSEILPGLWQGGTADDDTHHLRRYVAPAITKDDFDLVRIAKQTHRVWRNGARVLIRCQAGLNRSGLTMALVLIEEGYSAADAIDLIRAGRGDSALCTSRFERWLLDTHFDLPLAS